MSECLGFEALAMRVNFVSVSVKIYAITQSLPGINVMEGMRNFALLKRPLFFLYQSLTMTFTPAPLLCAGLIGYRALRLAGPLKTVGFYGFGSSAHLLIQVASALGKEVYVFTRPQDARTQSFARSLGAIWQEDQIYCLQGFRRRHYFCSGRCFISFKRFG